MPEPTLQVAQIVPCTEAEGPGKRFALWFQGCPLRCPGCCNPEFIPFAGGEALTLAAVLDQVDEARRTKSKPEANRMSVRLELQADYLAGVWAYHGQKKFNFLDPGYIESALNAAFQIGDDRLQKKARGRVVQESTREGFNLCPVAATG